MMTQRAPSATSGYDTMADYEAFQGLVDQLIEDGHEGQYVVFHDQAPTEFFPHIDEAMRYALDTYGPERFIAQKVEREGSVRLYSLLV